MKKNKLLTTRRLSPQPPYGDAALNFHSNIIQVTRSLPYFGLRPESSPDQFDAFCQRKIEDLITNLESAIPLGQENELRIDYPTKYDIYRERRRVAALGSTKVKKQKVLKK